MKKRIFLSFFLLLFILTLSAAVECCENIDEYITPELQVVNNPSLNAFEVYFTFNDESNAVNPIQPVKNAPLFIYIYFDDETKTELAFWKAYTNSEGFAKISYEDFKQKANEKQTAVKFKIFYCPLECACTECVGGFSIPTPAGVTDTVKYLNETLDSMLGLTKPLAPQDPLYVLPVVDIETIYPDPPEKGTLPAFCLPVAVISALLGGALYLTGRNPFSGFDLSAHKMRRQIRYSGGAGRGQYIGGGQAIGGALQAKNEISEKLSEKHLFKSEAAVGGKKGPETPVTAQPKQEPVSQSGKVKTTNTATPQPAGGRGDGGRREEAPPPQGAKSRDQVAAPTGMQQQMGMGRQAGSISNIATGFKNLGAAWGEKFGGGKTPVQHFAAFSRTIMLMSNLGGILSGLGVITWLDKRAEGMPVNARKALDSLEEVRFDPSKEYLVKDKEGNVHKLNCRVEVEDGKATIIAFEKTPDGKEKIVFTFVPNLGLTPVGANFSKSSGDKLFTQITDNMFVIGKGGIACIAFLDTKEKGKEPVIVAVTDKGQLITSNSKEFTSDHRAAVNAHLAEHFKQALPAFQALLVQLGENKNGLVADGLEALHDRWNLSELEKDQAADKKKYAAAKEELAEAEKELKSASTPPERKVELLGKMATLSEDMATLPEKIDNRDTHIVAMKGADEISDKGPTKEQVLDARFRTLVAMDREGDLKETKLDGKFVKAQAEAQVAQEGLQNIGSALRILNKEDEKGNKIAMTVLDPARFAQIGLSAFEATALVESKYKSITEERAEVQQRISDVQNTNILDKKVKEEKLAPLQTRLNELEQERATFQATITLLTNKATYDTSRLLNEADASHYAASIIAQGPESSREEKLKPFREKMEIPNFMEGVEATLSSKPRATPASAEEIKKLTTERIEKIMGVAEQYAESAKLYDVINHDLRALESVEESYRTLPGAAKYVERLEELRRQAYTTEQETIPTLKEEKGRDSLAVHLEEKKLGSLEKEITSLQKEAERNPEYNFYCRRKEAADKLANIYALQMPALLRSAAESPAEKREATLEFIHAASNFTRSWGAQKEVGTGLLGGIFSAFKSYNNGEAKGKAALESLKSYNEGQLSSLPSIIKRFGGEKEEPRKNRRDKS